MSDAPQDPTPTRTGIDRRKFIAGSAAATAGVWAAPSILSLDRASAQTGSPAVANNCTNSAFAVLIRATGPVTGTIAPACTCSNTGTGGLADVSAVLPGQSIVVTTASALTATCSQNPTCSARATVASATINTAGAGIPGLIISATTIDAIASCAGGVTTLNSTIASLTINGATIPVGAGPNTLVPVTLAGATVRLVINEQVAGSRTVNAIHLTVTTPGTPAIGLVPAVPAQTLDVIIASATASCT